MPTLVGCDSTGSSNSDRGSSDSDSDTDSDFEPPPANASTSHPSAPADPEEDDDDDLRELLSDRYVFKATQRANVVCNYRQSNFYKFISLV